MGSETHVEWCGRVPYRRALALQQRRREARRAGACGDVLLLLEHPPVVTLGRRANRANLRVDPATLASRGVELHEVSRGGDFTYHGPGQLIGYAVVDLRARGELDVIAFLRRLEAVLVDALDAIGIASTTRPGYTGVFVADPEPTARPRKIASIGIGVRDWITCHGFALNVGPDLSGFEWIVPCGLHDVEMTSVARELGVRGPDLAAVRERVAASFLRHFEADVRAPRLDSPPALRIGAAP